MRLRLTGIVAPMVLDGLVNFRSFHADVEHVLLPDMRLNDIAVMNNLGSYTGPGLRAAVEAAGASLRFLPPYSSDSNPTEMAFSKVKAHLRRAAEHTRDGLWE